MPVSATVRSRLEAQGFRNLDDETLAEIGPWMRWAPAICAPVMALGTIFASPPVLWGLAVIALFGVVFPRHPFDLLYNYGVRQLTRTRPLPRHGPQRRFACGLATVWLAATGLAFHEGAMVLGYVLGGVLTAVAVLVAVTHFCIPSLVYNTLFLRPVTHRLPGTRPVRG